jgi:uncharacterized membrane protein YphA (DoxX/SURF4 family)
MVTAVTISRLLIGVFFVLSGIANYYHFNDGFLATVLTSKLKLWGLGFSGVGPLPKSLATPFAYALPGVEILLGALFAAGLWVRGVGLILCALLLSFIATFGLFGDTLLPNGAPSFHKDVIFILAIWMIMAYERESLRRGV